MRHPKVTRSAIRASYVLAALVPFAAMNPPAQATSTYTDSCSGSYSFLAAHGTDTLWAQLVYTQDATYHHWQTLNYQISFSQANVGGDPGPHSNIGYRFLADGVLKHDWTTTTDAEQTWGTVHSKDLGFPSLNSKTEHWEISAIFDASQVPDPSCTIQHIF